MRKREWKRFFRGIMKSKSGEKVFAYLYGEDKKRFTCPPISGPYSP